MSVGEPSGVDRSSIEEYVRLSPSERMERAIGWALTIERLQTARVIRVGLG